MIIVRDRSVLLAQGSMNIYAEPPFHLANIPVCPVSDNFVKSETSLAHQNDENTIRPNGAKT